MFFDYDDEDDDEEPTPPLAVNPEDLKPKPPKFPESPPHKPPVQEIQNDGRRKPKWKRVQRRIYSPFWRGMHNLIAHPMLAIYRPLGEALHEFTARKMYEPRGGLPPIVTDND